MPNYILHKKNHLGVEYIYDGIRKKYVVLTPEEWVRQCCIKMMVEQLHYPIQSISVEKKIKIGALQKRYDMIIYKNAIPWILVECKAENVKIDGNTLLQSSHYNHAIQAEFIILTNGIQTICLNIKTKTWEKSLPIF